MALKNLAKFKDVRNSLTRHATRRYADDGIGVKTDIAIHHSLTRQGLGGSNAEGYARYHVNSLNWPGIAYHFVIEPDGTIKWANELGLRTFHVGNSNRYSIGICLTGDFRTEEPTDAQKESLAALVAALKKEMPNYRRTRGHNEFPGYSWKACPEFDYRAAITANTPVAAVHASSLPDTYEIQEGDTLWSIAFELDDVTVDDILAINPDINPANLRIGSKIRLKPAPKADEPDTRTVFKDMSDADKYTEIGEAVNGQVAELQRLLLASGESLPRWRDDGKPGQETLSAVKSFQRKHRLSSPGNTFYGRPGPATWAKLHEVVRYRGLMRRMTPMHRGVQVRQMQRAIGANADGVFGPKTADAVRAFQRRAGISVDGVVGPQTWRALFGNN